MIPARAENRSPSSRIGGHVRSERPVTFNRNQRSTWPGIRSRPAPARAVPCRGGASVAGTVCRCASPRRDRAAKSPPPGDAGSCREPSCTRIGSIRSTASAADASTAAAARYTTSTRQRRWPFLVYREPDMGGAHRSVPGSVWAVPIRCRNHCRGHSPDASLLAADAFATAVAGQHDGARPVGCIDSARWRGGATHADESAHTHPHNKCCRDRNGCRPAPAPHNAGSCRADSSARPAPAMPLPKHWTVLG